MNIRKAERRDLSFLYYLRNEPEVRAASWRVSIVDTDEHLDWFDKVIDDPNKILFILENNGVLVGQVRYDVDGEIAEVNVSVSNQHYGNGYASEGLSESAKLLFEDNPAIRIIFAHIKPDNLASIRTFEKAGYQDKQIIDFEGHKCVEMMLSRP